MKKFILLCLLAVSAVNAQGATGLWDLSLSDLLNVEVTTTSKFQEKASDSPGNIYVITREQIRKRGYQNVEDILKALPGVDIQNFSRFGNYNTFSIHGDYGNNKFLILQDGVRISAAGGENIPVTFNFPIYYAKRVEILIGPASVVHGADAFLGVINVITFSEKDSDLTEVSVRAGEDNYGYGYAHLNKKLTSDIHLNFGVQGYRSQDYDFAQDFPEYYPSGTTSPAGEVYEFPPNKDVAFFAKLRLKDSFEFGLNYSSFTSGTYSSSRADSSAFDTAAKETTHLGTLYGRYSVDISPELQATSLLTLMNYKLDNDSNFNNMFTGFEPEFKYANSDRYSFNQDFAYQLNEAHLISSGLLYEVFRSIPVGPDLPEPYNESKNHDDQNFFYPGTTLPMVLFKIRHENMGFFIQENWTLNKQWRFVGGIRFDHNTIYGNTTNPRISMIYKPDQKRVLKILYGHAFLAPSSDFAYRNFGSFNNFNEAAGQWESGFFRAPNPNLKPEKLRTLELIYEHWLTDKAYWKIVPFYTQVDDAIRVTADAQPLQFIPGADLGFTQSNKNVGDASIHGLDITTGSQKEFGSLNFEFWGAFSYVSGFSKESGVEVELPLVSPYKLKMGVTMAYREKYILSPKFYWIGTSNNFETDPNDASKRTHTPSYFLSDLHAEAKYTESLSIVGDIYNVFDKKYSHAMFEATGVALPEAPQPGRHISVGVLYQF